MRESLSSRNTNRQFARFENPQLLQYSNHDVSAAWQTGGILRMTHLRNELLRIGFLFDSWPMYNNNQRNTNEILNCCQCRHPFEFLAGCNTKRKVLE